MIGDVDIASVLLLLHGDSTGIADTSPYAHTLTLAGSVAVSSAQSVFGGYSILFGASSGKKVIAQGPEFAFGTGPFTLEGFFYPTDITGTQSLFDTRLASTQGYVIYTESGVLNFYPMVGGSPSHSPLTVSLATIGWTANAWHYLCIRRTTGGVVYIEVDGVAYNNTSFATLNIATTELGLGNNIHEASFPFKGYIDEVRACNIDRGNTGTPVAPFAEFAAQVFGTVTDENGDPIEVLIRAYDNLTGATLAGQTSSDPVDGSYTLNSSILDELSVTFLHPSQDPDPIYNNKVIRVIPG